MFVKIVIYAAGMSYCELFSIIVRILIDLLYRYELLNRRQKWAYLTKLATVHRSEFTPTI